MRICFIVTLLILGIAASGHAQDATQPQVKSLAEVAVYPQRSAPATVISVNETVISSQLQAQILAIPVLVGDQVKQGARLVNLDCADYRINLRAAEARLQLANSQLARVEKLLGQKLASQETVDARAADATVAKAETDRAQLAVDRCRVEAPFDALVVERLAAKGQLANNGTMLVRLIDQQNIELSAQVKAADAEHLSGVTTLYFEGGEQWPVTVRKVLDFIDPATRNREVRLLFTADKPLPGVAGKLVWREARPFIPAELIVRRQGQLGLFVEDAGKARFLQLENAQPGRNHPAKIPLETKLVVSNLSLINTGDVVAAGAQ